MNKQDFLDGLALQLQILDEREQRDILDEYAMHIDMKMAEGMSEEDVVRDFGNLHELAADVLEAYHVNPQYCGPMEVKRKAWKTPDMENVKEEGMKAYAEAGILLKRISANVKSGCKKFFRCLKTTFSKLVDWIHRRFFKKTDQKFPENIQDENMKTGEAVGRKETVRFEDASRKAPEVRRNSIRRTFKQIVRGCWHLISWFMKGCWNVFWSLAALGFMFLTVVMLFAFGVLVILSAQGSPIVGVTIASLGEILVFAAIAGLSCSLKREKNKKKDRTEESNETIAMPEEVQYE